MTSPAGPISLAQEYARATLAECATFQSWVGAADAAEALLSIYHDDLPAPNSPPTYTRGELEGYRPFVLIWTDDEGGGFSRIMDGVGFDGSFEFADSGRLKLQFEEDVPQDLIYDNAELMLQFKNTIGSILDDLCALAGTAGYLGFTRVTIDLGPYRADTKKNPRQGDFVGMDIGLDWGEAK